MKPLSLHIVIYFPLVFFWSCKKDIGNVNRGDYPHEIGKIINLKCAVEGCHNSVSSAAAGGYNLENWDKMFSGSNNGSPVIPYSSKFSSLCYFINTYPELGLQNKPTMPYNGKALSYNEVKLIKDWIDAGAPDINGNVKWADDPKRKKLYAVNQGCDVVTVFDSETHLPIRFIPVGRKPSSTPHMIRVSPDGNYWYVVFINDDVMQKYRCSDDAYAGDIPLTFFAAGTGPEDALNWNTFVITKDGKYAYCVSWPDGKISKVDLVNRKLIHFIGGQTVPHAIVLNATEDKFYFAAQTGNYMTEMDTGFTTTNEIVLDNAAKTTSSSLDPHDMVLSPNNSDIFITCQQSNQVRVYNIPTNSVIATITTGFYPQEIVYSKSTNQYFVSCMRDSSMFPGSHGVITRIDPVGYTAKHVQCGFQPHGLAVDETKKVLYVLSRNYSSSGPPPHHSSQCTGRNGFVNFIDLNTFKVKPERYELSADPYFISARP